MWEGHGKAPGIVSWKGSCAGSGGRARTGGGVCVCARVCLGSRLAGLAFTKCFLDQPLAEPPQGPGSLLTLGFRGGQAAAAVVEIHPSQALQLRSSSTVDGGGSSLLLEIKGKRRKNLFLLFFFFKKRGDEMTFF